MHYYEYQFPAPADQHEILTGWLSTLPFEAFSEESDQLKAYLESAHVSQEIDEQVDQIAQRFQIRWTKVLMPNENWNAKWEAQFPPISVGNFCGIRADFHPPFGDTVQHELVINPEMAFGTGHHSTTYLMIHFLSQMDVAGLKVFDYGCGTGVLGLLAMKMGAQHVDGIDYDILSVENSLKNAIKNGLQWEHLAEATLDQYDQSGYDLVLANINRNVILDSLDTLYPKVNPGGLVLFSGFYEKDFPVMEEALTNSGFQIKDQQIRQDWLCLKVEKPN
ncbi:MAG: 50S ribosomal protein L11 methyltransferase [Bacteroidota bacterium]